MTTTAPDPNLPYVLAYLRTRSFTKAAAELYSNRETVRQRVDQWLKRQEGRGDNSPGLRRCNISDDGRDESNV